MFFLVLLELLRRPVATNGRCLYERAEEIDENSKPSTTFSRVLKRLDRVYTPTTGLNPVHRPTDRYTPDAWLGRSNICGSFA